MKVISMKKFLFLFTVLALALTGCFNPPEVTEPTETTEATQATSEAATSEATQEPTIPLSDYSAPMVSFASPVVTESYDGNVLEYTYQVMELLLEDPQVSEWVTLELVNHTDFSATAGPQFLAEAKETGQQFSLSLLHTPVRLDRGILSLISTQVVSGTGAKATGVMTSSTYNLISGRRLTLKEVLIPGYDALAFSNAVIAALESLAKEGSLYSDYDYVITDLFSSNAPVDNWYLSQTGLCVYFAPYEIAPYNLGNVIAEIPYESLVGLLREEYFPDEDLGLVGNLYFSGDLSILQSQSQFRDLILDAEGKEYVLVVDGAVEDLRIESATRSATVFASATLCQGDAIVIRASDEILADLSVSYRSGGEIFRFPIFAFFPVG